MTDLCIDRGLANLTKTAYDLDLPALFLLSTHN